MHQLTRRFYTMLPLLVYLVTIILRDVYAHPQCINSYAPFDTVQLEFCQDYSLFGCCDQDRDAAIKQLYDKLEADVTSPNCREKLKEMLCQECNPYAAHLFTIEANGIKSPLPGLCEDYCTTFHQQCANIVSLITDDVEIKDASTRSTEEFCDKVSLDSEYCYPRIRDDPNLQTWIEESRTGTGRYGEGCICLDEFANGLRNPILAVHANDSTHRLFIAEQIGVIYVYLHNKTKIDEPFLDIQSQVLINLGLKGDERGLLGLAFHPNHASNRKLYLFYNIYSSNHKIRISEFQTQADNINKVDASSERIILEVDQPRANHNGGQILFGTDGYLYATLGDGGGQGDQFGTTGNGQNLATLLGTMIRIDIDRQENGNQYAIPADNPFVNEDPNVKRHEIYAYGTRNMWRCSVDRGDPVTGDGRGRIFCGDVGQNLYEEVDIIVKGGNYGWRGKEGNQCYDNNLCAGLESEILPINVYDHSIGKSITGGFVYRGCESPKLHGKYIFGDYANGRMFELTEDSTNQWSRKDVCFGDNTICTSGLVNTYPIKLLAFGEDESGEVYALTTDVARSSNTGGKVFKIVEPSESGNCETNRVPVTVQGSTSHFIPSQPVQCYVYPVVLPDPVSPSSQLTISWNCDDANAKFQVTYQLINKDQCDDGNGNQDSPFNRMVIPWSSWSRQSLGDGNYGHSGTLPNLLAYSTYRVFVQSRMPNPAGGYWLGPVGDAVQEATGEAAPSSTPVNVQNSMSTNTSLTFTWLQPPCGERKGFNLSYDYILSDDMENTVYSGTTCEHFATIHDLVSCNTYNFVVKAFNDAGYGSFSGPVTATTAVGVPDQVQSLVTDAITSSTWTLSWYFILSNPCVPDDYLVEYALLDKDQCDEVTTPERNSYGNIIDKHVTITGLQPHSTYQVFVLPRNAFGKGREISTVAVTGETEPSAPPANIRSLATANNSLTFGWQHVPCGHRGGVNSYRYELRNDKQQLINQGITSDLFITIKSLAPCTTYSFEVNGFNSAGDGSVSELVEGITEMTAPGPVQSLHTDDISSNTCTVSWDPQVANQCSTDDYGVAYVLINKDQCEEPNNTEPLNYGYVTDTTVFLTELRSHSHYEVFVYPRNSGGSGLEISHIIETQESKPTGVPRNVLVTEIGQRHLSFSWMEPECGQRNGGIVMYLHALNDTSTLPDIMGSTDKTTITISDLRPYVRYSFRVAAVTSAGQGPLSEAIIGRTREDIPDAPRNLTALTTSNIVLLLWKPPRNPNGVLIDYTIKYQSLYKSYDPNYVPNDQHTSITLALDAELPIHEKKIANLEPSTVYEFKVFSRTAIGPGEDASVEVTTEAFKDLKTPEIPKVIISGSSTVIEFSNLPKYVSNVYVAVQKVVTGKRRKRQGESQNDTPDDFIVANLTRSDIEDKAFVVGDGKIYGGYRNHPLLDGETYAVTVAYASCTFEECNVAWSNPSITTAGRTNTRTTKSASAVIWGGIGAVIFIGICIFVALILCFALKPVISPTPKDSNTYDERDPQTDTVAKQRNCQSQKPGKEVIAMEGKPTTAHTESGSEDMNVFSNVITGENEYQEYQANAL